ncbi:hypothetical protein BRADI_3g53334v3 [Brachypodium distachyon]|uniref:Uncharacterized protein n=1 Tax=Brachypodium distachyon TaxID=15368 RepID=A0A2K2D4V7_BRADI|nr:hypothetical protein BRADI_3g53334v3 [Brachypodium distachyon]
MDKGSCTPTYTKEQERIYTQELGRSSYKETNCTKDWGSTKQKERNFLQHWRKPEFTDKLPANQNDKVATFSLCFQPGSF